VIPIYPYQTQEVRDLAWACFSPELLHARAMNGDNENVSDCALELTTARRNWLEQLDRDATPLLHHLSEQRSQRLGVYFEHLWHFFLEQDPDVDLVAHNLPIHAQGRTIGEFDCIYFCHRRQCHVHLELAVKYFLSERRSSVDEQASQWHEWLGPNANDRLDRKIHHLMRRQIRLGEQAQAIATLDDMGIRELAREVSVKGHLFQSVADPLPPPRGFNSNCRLGRHLPISALGDYLSRPDDRHSETYLILPRVRWLSAAVEHGPLAMDRQTLGNTLHRHFSHEDRPQLVTSLNPAGNEIQRFFVTPDNWPDDQYREAVRSEPGVELGK
jgi:hypothetical protein